MKCGENGSSVGAGWRGVWAAQLLWWSYAARRRCADGRHLLGDNVFLFSDLIAQYWKSGGASAVGAKSGLLRLAWQVLTNTQTKVPFDFCIGNVRALR